MAIEKHKYFKTGISSAYDTFTKSKSELILNEF